MGDPLTITPIGVGAAYARSGEAQSAYLVTFGRTQVCLDLGAGALNQLQRVVRPEDVTAILISHLHADHCVDLFSLRIYMEYGPGVGRRIHVYGPRELPDRLQAFGGDGGWDGFEFHPLDEPGGELALDDLRLRWTEVPHSHPTFALRIDAPGGSVTYGADCGPNDALAALARDTDVLIAECGLGLGPSPADAIHLSATDAGDIARRAGARRLLLTHCYPEHDRDAVLAAAAAAFGGPVAWATQGEAVTASTV